VEENRITSEVRGKKVTITREVIAKQMRLPLSKEKMIWLGPPKDKIVDLMKHMAPPIAHIPSEGWALRHMNGKYPVRMGVVLHAIQFKNRQTYYSTRMALLIFQVELEAEINWAHLIF